MEKNQDQVIEQTVNRIVELFHPSRVIEYNTKYDMDDNISAFKLCIVGDIPDKRRMLTRIFDEVDSDIPYDVLLYTDEQFRELTKDDGAFASHVNQKGRVRYEK